jgi:hypothetical protein
MRENKQSAEQIGGAFRSFFEPHASVGGIFSGFLAFDSNDVWQVLADNRIMRAQSFSTMDVIRTDSSHELLSNFP